jgi:hypothetical protein
MTVTRIQKIAFVAATVVLLGAAVAATFAPSSVSSPQSRSGVQCGTWAAPDWPSDQPFGFVTSRDVQIHGLPDEVVDDLAILDYRCDERLDSRRLLSLILAGLAIALPLGVFVLGARRRQRT